MNILEQLAELEHTQWVSWVSNLIEKHGRDLPISLREEWLKNMLPYHHLPEEEKEKDRIWARKTIQCFIDSELYRRGIK